VIGISKRKKKYTLIYLLFLLFVLTENIKPFEFHKEALLEPTKIHPEIIKEMQEKPQAKVNVVIISSIISSEYLDSSQLIKLAADNSTVGIYPNIRYSALLEQSVPQINANAVWDAGFTGKNIKIAILDTGIDSEHPMLKGRVILEKDFTGGNNANDALGHGTHAAGIAAGKKDGKEGYNGVAPDAVILNAKVLNDNGNGFTSSIIAGIAWAAANGADVISLSLGAVYSGIDVPLKEAIDDAINQGVVVVVASGNCGSGCPSRRTARASGSNCWRTPSTSPPRCSTPARNCARPARRR